MSSVTVNGSLLTIAYTNDTNIQGDALVLKASDSGGSVEWECGATGTTVESKYLPSNCR